MRYSTQRAMSGADARRGGILMIAVVLVVITFGLSHAYLVISASQARATGDRRCHATALALAEQGVDHARVHLVAHYGVDSDGRKTTGWDDELLGADGVAWTADDGVLPIGAGVRTADGSYAVILRDNEDGDGDPFTDVDERVVIDSRGVESQGAEERICAVVRREEYDPTSEYAVLVEGDLQLSGNPSTRGRSASVHANRDLYLGGSALVERDAEAGREIDIQGRATVGGRSVANAPIVAIPPIDPTRLRSSAACIFTGTGSVLDAQGLTVWSSADANDTWNGWRWNATDLSWNWTGSGDLRPPGGVCYFEVNVHVTGTPGTKANPWVASLVSERNIVISGNPRIVPPSGRNEVLLAGGDVVLLGTSGVGSVDPHVRGIVAAHEQVYLGGTTSIVGRVIAEDAPSRADSWVQTNTIVDDEVLGNVQISYDGGLRLPFATRHRVPIQAWEMRLPTELGPVRPDLRAAPGGVESVPVVDR